MLNVWTVCVGDKYTINHVKNIERMVKKNYKRQFRMNCITEKNIDGINCIYPDADKPGWWNKLSLFKHASGPCIYFDLDVIISGDLLIFEDFTDCFLAMPKNWAMSGHGGYQSSVMCWYGSPEHRIICDYFNAELLSVPKNGNYGSYGKKALWGDQEYLTEYFSNNITEIPPGVVVSYKYHARTQLPTSARVVAFHGAPKYDEVKHDWIDQALL